MSRDITTKEMSEILSLGKLTIPNFQRDFVWRPDEATDLFKDLLEEAENPSDDGIYLGTIILHTKNKNSKEFEIVDGQQRITSLMILLIAIRVKAASLEAGNDFALSIQDRIAFRHLGEDRGVRLETARNIKPAFDQAAMIEWSGGISQNPMVLNILVSEN